MKILQIIYLTPRTLFHLIFVFAFFEQMLIHLRIFNHLKTHFTGTQHDTFFPKMHIKQINIQKVFVNFVAKFTLCVVFFSNFINFTFFLVIALSIIAHYGILILRRAFLFKVRWLLQIGLLIGVENSSIDHFHLGTFDVGDVRENIEIEVD